MQLTPNVNCLNFSFIATNVVFSLNLKGLRFLDLWVFFNRHICCLCSLDPPTSTGLTTSLVNTTVLWGSTVSLNCSTDANPAAYRYQFYFNDAIIGNHSSGLLNITVDADGGYTCVPINTVGTGHNATVSITMVGKSLIFLVE